MCCTALYCTALHCSVLHCTALHCTVLHCTVLYCTVLHCTTHCTALHCTALHCTVLYCTVLYCTVLHCTALHDALHCIALYCTALYQLASLRKNITEFNLALPTREIVYWPSKHRNPPVSWTNRFMLFRRKWLMRHNLRRFKPKLAFFMISPNHNDSRMGSSRITKEIERL